MTQDNAMKNPLTPAKPGRPKRDPLLNLEQAVARSYASVVTWRAEFRKVLEMQYPQLSENQYHELSQPIFSIAEEYNYWSKVDGLLLGLQRSSRFNEQLKLKRESISNTINDMAIRYHWVLSARDAHQHKILIDLEQVEATIEEINALNLHSSATQSIYLYALTQKIQSALLNKLDKNTTLIIRRLIRVALQLIRHYRLGLLYQNASQTKAGRPTLPIPILLNREEQNLIEHYLDLRELYRQRQLIQLTPEQLWNKHKTVLEKSGVGRPSLSEKEKTARLLASCQQKLVKLRCMDEDQTPQATTGLVKRGRRPETKAEKIRKLVEKISKLEAHLVKLSHPNS